MISTDEVFRRLQDSMHRVSIDEIRCLEQQLTIRLPDDYVSFLLQCNGGYFNHEVSFIVKHPGRYVSEGRMDAVFGIVGPSDWEMCWDVRDRYESFLGRVPAGFVPIARSKESYIICIASKESNASLIWMWDLTGDDSPSGNAYELAGSFTEFLAILTPESEKRDWIERMPVFVSIERGSEKEVVSLSVLGEGLDVRNERGQSLLMVAARSSWPQIVSLLLERGANPNAVDFEGNTALHHAIYRHSHDSVLALIAAGADVNSRNYSGQCILERAIDCGSDRIADTLEKCGARGMVESADDDDDQSE